MFFSICLNLVNKKPTNQKKKKKKKLMQGSQKDTELAAGCANCYDEARSG
jgi:hypothetical protein